MLVGNKLDLATDNAYADDDESLPPPTPSSVGSNFTITPSSVSTNTSTSTVRQRDYAGSISSTSQQRATVALDGREVTRSDATRWASQSGISVMTEASALNGENVDEIFERLATMILTKIELGDIDPDDPNSGIQYGDSGGWGAASDGASIKSSMTGATADDVNLGGIRRRRKPTKTRGQNWTGLREWEEVFTLSSSGRRRGGNCC